jgi:C2 domain
MLRGDYMIHVLIEQAKDIKIDAEDTVDPIVEVKCLGKRKFTKALKDINNTSVAIWNEHIFFEPKNKETEELERGKIEIKLMDKGYFKDGLIGFYEFDLSYLYQ